MRGGLSALAVVVVLTGMPTVVHADTPEERANALYLQAKAKTTEGDLAAAEALFSQAWSIFPHPLIIKKRAEVRERRIDINGALEDYRTYLGVLKASDRRERRLVLERISTLDALLVKPVKTTIIASQSGVRVSVDGAEPRVTPFSLHLIPGTHVLKVRDERYKTVRQEFEVQAGRPDFARIAVEMRQATVILGSDADSLGGLQLRLDGERLSITDAEQAARYVERKVEPGSYRLTCRRSDGAEVSVDFRVALFERTTASCSFQTLELQRIADPWGWVTVGASAAALGTGIGFLASWANDLELAKARNQTLKSTKHIAGGVLVGVGAALAVGSYFVFMREGDVPQEPSGAGNTSVVPAPILTDFGGLGLGAVGRF